MSDRHYCIKCGRAFNYCRACVFKPDPYKEAGFCSKGCYEASKIKVVDPETIEKPVLVEESKQVDKNVEGVTPVEEKIPVEAEIAVSADVTTTVIEPTIEKEIYNTYKKKKNKYR